MIRSVVAKTCNFSILLYSFLLKRQNNEFNEVSFAECVKFKNNNVLYRILQLLIARHISFSLELYWPGVGIKMIYFSDLVELSVVAVPDNQLSLM